MGFLIDTNILSEVQKGARADPGVRAWYDAADPRELYLSVLVLGEVRQGIDRLRRPLRAMESEAKARSPG